MKTLLSCISTFVVWMLSVAACHELALAAYPQTTALKTVRHDDETVVTATLRENLVLPPDIHVNPDSLSEELFTGGTSVQSLTISNNGDSDLSFEISLDELSPAVSVTIQSHQAASRKTKPSLQNYDGPNHPLRRDLTRETVPHSFDILPQVRQPYASGDILIIGDGGTESTIEPILTAAGYTVTIVSDDAIYDGTNPAPEGFDAVILLDGVDYGDDMPVTGQTALVAYVENGGGFILTEWVAYEVSEFRYQSMTGLVPLSRTSGYSGFDTYTVILDHPVTEGVNEMFDLSTGGNIGFANSGSVLVTGTTAGDAVVAKEFGEGRIVEFSSAGNYDGWNPFSVPEMQLLLTNAASWASGGPSWISVQPESGVIPSGDSADIEVTFDATGLNGGDYNANILISSNDPDEPEVIVPAHLHVTGAPDITVSEDSIDFGLVFIDGSVTLTLTVDNTGTDLLSISNISSDHTDFTVDTTSFDLSPGESQEVQVTFAPTSKGLITGSLTINSNDPDEPVVTVVLQGEGALPPDITVSPTSLEEDLFTGEMSTQTLTISNEGFSDLSFDITIEGMVAASTSVNLTHRQSSELFNRREQISKGMGKEYPPTFEKSDNSTSMKRGNGMSAGVSAQANFLIIDHGMDKTLFGGYTYTTITEFDLDGLTVPEMEQYDVIYFEPDWISYSNLTNNMSKFSSYVDGGGVVAINIAGNIGDGFGIDPAGTNYSRSITHESETIADPNHPYITGEPFGGSLLTVSDFDNWGSTDHGYLYNYPGNSQVVLVNTQDASWIQHPFGGGEVILTTLTYGWGGGGARGNPLANLIDYVFYLSFTSWLTVDPGDGTVPAGSSMDILVTFDATGLNGGDYNANILVSSNDPDEPEVIVPAHLHVTGAPDISVSEDSIDFGLVFIDGSATLTLTVENTGTDLLGISNISSDHTDFTVDTTSFDLSPGESQEVQVTFAPSSKGPITGSLTINSNDPDEPVVTVVLQGEGALPPDISVNPAILEEELLPGEISTQSLTISNDGFSDLNFEISINEAVAAGLAKRTSRVPETIPTQGPPKTRTIVVERSGRFRPNSEAGPSGPSARFQAPLIKKAMGSLFETVPDFLDISLKKKAATPSQEKKQTSAKSAVPTTGAGTPSVTQARMSPESSASGDLLPIAELVASFPDYSGNSQPMSIAFDGTFYWVVGGGFPDGDVAQLNADFALVTTQNVALDCRSISYSPADGEVYIKDWTNNGLFRLHTDPFDGGYDVIFTGIFQDQQSKVCISPDGQFLFDHLNGTVRQYDFATGSVVNTITLDLQHGLEWPRGNLLGHSGTYLLTLADEVVYAHDETTGDFVASSILPGVNVDEWSMAYTSGLFFATNTDLLTWYAFRIDEGSLLWLSVEPSSGTLPAGLSLDVEVTFDATELDTGYYYANITISSNDPDEPEVAIPVELAVVALPSQVALLSPLDGAIVRTDSVVFVWRQSSPEVDRYWFELATDSLFVTAQVDSMQLDTTTVGNNFKNNQMYWWRVRAHNFVGWGDFSESWTFFATNDVPSTPTLVYPASGASGIPHDVTLIWNPATVAESYSVQVSVDSVFSTYVVSDSGITTTSYDLKGLSDTTTYYWRVRARNINGTSGWSETWHFTTRITAWVIQPSGTTSNLYGVSFIDANVGTAVGSSGTILRTTNGGSSWSAQASGTTGILYGASYTDASVGSVVGANGTILRTTDGGTTWMSQSSGTSSFLYDVVFTQTDIGTAVGSNGTILRTTNGGVTWSSQTSNTSSALFGVSFTDESIGTAVGFAGTIRRTTDGGATWVAQASGTTRDLWGISFVDANTGSVVGASGTILHTTDGGATWTSQTSGTTNFLYGLSFSDANTGTIAGSNGTILHTTDGGSSWTNQASTTMNILNGASFVDANTGTVVGGGGTILRTTTAGMGVFPPEAPTLAFPPDGATGISSSPMLSWNPSAGALWYTLQVGLSPAFTSIVLNKTEIDSTFEELNGLEHGTTHYWHVSLRDSSALTSHWSETWSFTVTVTGVGENEKIPTEFSLSQNYPNPFNPSTTIRYGLPQKAHVLLELFNVLGQRVAVLVDEEQEVGYHRAIIERASLASGAYFYRLQAGGFVESKKVILIR